VARHVAQGRTDAEVATAMSISKRTVATHLASIRTQLDLGSRVEVALWATSDRGATGPLPPVDGAPVLRR
jgi:DNA-binding CsgD family transcriptional regulator